MRLVIATCTVDYAGPAGRPPALATRLLMVKADGSVAIHADGGAYKPLNWMTRRAPCARSPGAGWSPTRKGETLTITIEEVHADVGHELGCRPRSAEGRRRGPSAGAAGRRPGHVLEPGLRLVRREYPTDIGPVDLLCRDDDGRAVAIEIKRRGEIDGVEQLARYLERLDLDGRLRPVRGIFAAQQIKPQAQVLATARGIACVEVDYDALRGVGLGHLTLF